MIYLQRPKDFKPSFAVSNSFIENDGKFLLLLRQPYKTQASKWGLPGGKIEFGEDKTLAAIRELQEETSIALREEDISFFMTVFVRYPNVDFTYHMFSYTCTEAPSIIIDPEEHVSFTWSNPQDSFKLPLVDDLADCIRLFYNLPRL